MQVHASEQARDVLSRALDLFAIAVSPSNVGRKAVTQFTIQQYVSLRTCPLREVTDRSVASSPGLPASFHVATKWSREGWGQGQLKCLFTTETALIHFIFNCTVVVLWYMYTLWLFTWLMSCVLGPCCVGGREQLPDVGEVLER